MISAVPAPAASANVYAEKTVPGKEEPSSLNIRILIYFIY
jgi:hypothetical protein